MSLPLLSLSIWLPISFALLVLLGARFFPNKVGCVANMGSALSFLITLPLLFLFDSTTVALQFTEKIVWISQYAIYYHLGIDGISLWFIPLTALITWIVMLIDFKGSALQQAQYKAAFLVLSGLMIGVFSALDGLLFYVFFEATLIPMYLIIGIWGGPERVYAAFKFFLYTLLGSLLMLVALLYLYSQSASFSLLDWYQTPLSLQAQILLFIAFFFAFAVKIPMLPVHTWLPDVHVEAPTGGSVILAAIMLKLGAYGLLRFSLPIVPDASHFFSGAMIALSLSAIIYIGWVALVQSDLKKLVAYSSIMHMGFVTLGFFLFTEMAIQGALIQMISHGIISSALFLCIGILYERLHTRKISDYGGVAVPMPKFSAFFVLFAMANCGLPVTSGFIGEFFVILAAIKAYFWIGVLAATSLIIGAAYSLWMVKRVVFGPVIHAAVQQLHDINAKERALLALFAALTLIMGIYPKPFTDTTQASVSNLLSQMQTKLPHIHRLSNSGGIILSNPALVVYFSIHSIKRSLAPTQ